MIELFLTLLLYLKPSKMVMLSTTVEEENNDK